MPQCWEILDSFYSFGITPIIIFCFKVLLAAVFTIAGTMCLIMENCSTTIGINYGFVGIGIALFLSAAIYLAIMLLWENKIKRRTDKKPELVIFFCAKTIAAIVSVTVGFIIINTYSIGGLLIGVGFSLIFGSIFTGLLLYIIKMKN